MLEFLHSITSGVTFSSLGCWKNNEIGDISIINSVSNNKKLSACSKTTLRLKCLTINSGHHKLENETE